MPTSRYRSMARRAAIAMAVMLAGCTPHRAATDSSSSPCTYNELQRQAVDPSQSVYRSESFPWIALVDETRGIVDVRGKTSPVTCRIDLEDVRRVYGGRQTLVLRVIEISADYLFFFDPLTCKTVRAPINLGVHEMEAEEVKQLRQAGICQASVE